MKLMLLCLRTQPAFLLCALALLAASSLACKKKSSGDDAAPVATVAAGSAETDHADKCAAMGTKVGGIMKKSSPTGQLTAEAKAKLDAVFAKAEDKMVANCTADKWPSDFLACVGAAEDSKALDGCKLPPDLEKKMMEDMQALVPEIIEAMQGAQPLAPVTDSASTPKGN